MSGIPGRDELVGQARLLATRVAFDALIEEGVIEKRGSWYRIKDPERLPEHAWRQVTEVKMSAGSVSEVKFAPDSERKRAAQLYYELTGQRVAGE